MSVQQGLSATSPYGIASWDVAPSYTYSEPGSWTHYAQSAPPVIKLKGAVRVRPRLAVGATGQFSLAADLAVANGEVVQVCSVWSFQLIELEEVTRDVQAWGWNIRELREHGGVLVRDDRGQEAAHVPADVDVEVLVAPDAEPPGIRALENARNVFEEVGATLVEFGQEHMIAERAHALLPG